MHVRRALLLFAIVLGLAALAASLSRPRDDEPSPPPEQATTSTPAEEPAPEASPREEPTEVADTSGTIAMDADAEETRRLEAGRSASVEVTVDKPGQVAIPELGLTGAADPLTPARFDVLVNTEGRYPIEFTPAGTGESGAAGTLIVTPQSG